MKVTTDGCLFGAWAGRIARSRESEVRNVLDIGTGTGLLSLMFVQQNPDVTIDAIEIDKDAYEQAKENIAASPWKDRIHVFNADVKNHEFDKKYDAVICNPPFYENELKSTNTKKNTAHHSSDLTLSELLDTAKKVLSDEGMFFFLFPYKRKDEIENFLTEHSLFIHEIVLVKQSVRHDAFRVMIAGGLHRPGGITTKEISVRNEKEEYTAEFVSLLKDYYLYL